MLTYDLASDIGKLRLAIGDHRINDDAAGIQPTGQHYTDEELMAFINMTGDWRTAVPVILRSLATLYSAMAQSVSFDGYSESYSGTAASLFAAASSWEAGNQTAAGAGQTLMDVFGAYQADYLFTTDRFPPL